MTYINEYLDKEERKTTMANTEQLTDKTEIYQRRALGILGMLLPILDIGFGFFWCKYVMKLDIDSKLFESISSTHYSYSYLLFEGIVFAVAMFLICYRGYDIKDFWITTITGILGVFLCLFPTATGGFTGYNFIGLPPEITQWVHYVTSILFFVGLAVMEIWQFTKTSDKEPTKRKKIRNIIYKTCGITMLASIFIAGALGFLFKIPFVLYIGEGLGLEAFGIAWLVKGNTLFKD